MSTLSRTAKKIHFELWLFFLGLWQQFRAIEVSLTSLLFWWAIVLLLPYDTFGSSEGYHSMASIASEETWGFAILAIAIINLIGLAKGHQKIRMIGLLLAMGLWVFVAMMFALSNVIVVTTGTYIIVAALNGYVFVKVGECNDGR